jgi:hypothetical protein
VTREEQIQTFKEATGISMPLRGISCIDDLVGKTTMYVGGGLGRKKECEGLFIHGWDNRDGQWSAIYGVLRATVEPAIMRLCAPHTPHALKVSKTLTDWATVSVEADGFEIPLFLTMIYYDDYQRWLAERMS